jgi:hypothetical protein
MIPLPKKRPRQKWIKEKCVWCGREFKAARFGALTDSNKCRLRLHYYRRETGFAPDEPPGDITAHAALDLLILTLIRRERERRERAAAS